MHYEANAFFFFRQEHIVCFCNIMRLILSLTPIYLLCLPFKLKVLMVEQQEQTGQNNKTTVQVESA